MYRTLLAVNVGGTGIVATYNTTSHTLTLTGETSGANYQQVFRTLTGISPSKYRELRQG